MKETVKYYGLVHKDKGSEYGVSFPDFPGCVTAGATLEEAAEAAHEALQLHIDGMVEDGESVPSPTRIDDLGDAVAMVPVSAGVSGLATVRVNITARESDLKMIDGYLRSHGRLRDRSEFLISSALAFVKGEISVEIEDDPDAVRALRQQREQRLMRSRKRKKPASEKEVV